MKSKMWFRIFILIATYICLLGARPTYAAENEVIKIGYTPDYGTLVKSVEQGRRGYGFEYFEEIAKYTGWKYEYISCSWAEGLEMLKSGKIDFFGPLQKSAEREAVYEYPDTEFGYEYGALFAHKDSKIYYEDIEALDGLKVGMEPGFYYNKMLEEYCKDNQIQMTMIPGNIENAQEDLQQGIYDLFVTGSLYDIPDTKIVMKLSADPFYYAAKKGNKELVNKLNQAMKSIQKEDAYFAAKLYENYFGNKTISKPTFTKQEKELLEQYPKLIVGMEANAAPIQYLDKKTGELKGISVDILNKIAEECGTIFEFVSAKDTDGYGVDLDLYAGYHKHTTGDEGIDAIPYMEIPMVLVGKEVQNQKDKLKVGMVDADTYFDDTVLNKYMIYNTIKYKNIAEVVEALNDNSVDLIFIPIYVFDEISRRLGTQKYISFSTDIKYSLEIGVSKQLPEEFVSILTKAIQRNSKIEMDSIVFANTVGRAYDVPFGQVIKNNTFVIMAGAAMILAVMFVLIIIIIKTDESKRKALIEIAYVDEIVNLPTLFKFKLDANKFLEDAKPDEYTLIAIDIDNFKYINDIFGFEMGNRVLLAFAKIIKEIPGSKKISARTSADNFIILCKSKDKNVILDLFKGEMPYMPEIFSLLGENYNLKFSLGVYTINNPHKDISIMIDYSNIAKKSAKDMYENSIMEYTEAMDVHLKDTREILLVMEQALLLGEFVPFMQPKYSLETGEIVGAEALVRWFSSTRGMVSPVEFIPLLEKNGFIQKLDIYMFEKVCELIQQWKCEGIDSIPRISVNISKVTLLKPAFAETLLSLVDKYDLDSSQIELELTESVLGDNVAYILRIMSELKQTGFYISIDDFGSGYSSLNLLKDIQADVLKIDKEFLGETLGEGIHNEKGKIIISNIINMSKALQLETVAEGVETKEQAEQLRKMGCNIAQGYYFARPLPSGEFKKLLIDRGK